MARLKFATQFFLPATGIAVLALSGCTQSSKSASPLTDTALSTQQRVDGLVKQMTLEEKVSQMMDQSPAIPRLGIPEYNWWSEGLHGIARSGYATMFPQAIGMAATWDTEMIHQESTVIATEARAKYNHAIAQGNHGRYFGLTIWSPNINLVRDPRWGRGQETYGEDPFLTATLGSAYVRGLQGTNPKYYEAIATPKHFALYSGPESTRHKANVVPSAYDFEATYLPAFRATIVGAHADSLMCSYNAVDGTPSCANTMLLKQTLRDDWGFHGYVTSDCGAVQNFYQGHGYSPDAAHAAASAVLAGTDTNCGDTYKALVQAVHENLLPVSAINTAVERLFTARIKLGMFDPKSAVPYNNIPFSADNSPAHRALAEKAAVESMVLLRNENGILPLRHAGTIAVVGPNAASLLALEGNYNAIPEHPVLAVDGMEAKFGHVLYAQGSPYLKGIEIPAPRTLFHTTSGQQGLAGEYFSSAQAGAAPVATRVDKQVDFDWAHASPVPGLPQDNFAVRWSGTITAPKSGKYQFGVRVGHCGPNCTDKEQLSATLDGKPVDLSKDTAGSDTGDSHLVQMDLTFPDTQPHAFTLEYRHDSKKITAGISLRWMAPVDTERDEAVAAAKKADVTVAFVGLDSELEGEEMPLHVRGFMGGDRTLIDLPPVQQQLLHALAATGKPLVVVLMNGSALAVDWTATHAKAILEAWYPGETGGEAIADTLAGDNDPGGKLPVTFYTGVSELPPFADYSMKNRTYRFFTGKPLYGFGYGLSYTKFAFSGLKLSTGQVQAGQPLTVNAEVKNTGSVAGDEVAELYMMPPQNGLSPKLELVGFQRVHLAPGEQTQVQITLDPRRLSTVDSQGNRAVRAGEYGFYLGGGQPDAPGIASGVRGKFTITGEKSLPR